MIKAFSRHLRKAIAWRAAAGRLKPMSKLEEFEAYVEEVKPSLFLQHRSWSAHKRLDFEAVLEKLQLEPKGLKFLDMGPGYGDTLDICHERGAAAVDFVEYDLFFYTYNRLKGFSKGYKLNILKHLNQLEANKYNLIWSRATIVPDLFTSWWRWLVSLNKLLDQVDRISAPDSKVVICPFWQAHNNVRRIQDTRNNRFTRIMLKHGYHILRPIENHNKEPFFPFTFLKDNSKRILENVYE